MLSKEGTTQGDNLAMSFYALSASGMIATLQNLQPGVDNTPAVKQVWLAADGNGAGTVVMLNPW